MLRWVGLWPDNGLQVPDVVVLKALELLVEALLNYFAARNPRLLALLCLAGIGLVGPRAGVVGHWSLPCGGRTVCAFPRCGVVNLRT